MKKKIIQLLSCLILDKEKRKRFRENSYYIINQNSEFKKILQKIKNNLKQHKKIKVCFSVVYDSVFPAENLFKAMLDDNAFEPFILVIPDALRGEENMFYQMEKTYNTLSSKYDVVYNSYDYNQKEFIDWSDKCDMMCFANPYDSMTHGLYTVAYLKDKVLTFHIPYSYTGHLNYNLNIYKMQEYSSFWRVFVENKKVLKLITKSKLINNKNLKVIGYPKMDSVHNFKGVQTERPLVVIAPHHTVKRIPGYLNISQFLKYSDFFLELPKKFPDVDFVFRPHQLLFVVLAEQELWGKQKVCEYIEKMKSISNVEYQEGGEYFETFAKSSALINDCGSFLLEYFYFNKPQCFLLEDENQIQQEFTEIGKEVLKYTYTAFNEKQIEDFIIENVVQKKDYMKLKREIFAKKNVMVNYPSSTKKLIEYLKREMKHV